MCVCMYVCLCVHVFVLVHVFVYVFVSARVRCAIKHEHVWCVVCVVYVCGECVCSVYVMCVHLCVCM